MTTEAYELPPVHIDRERMDKALAGPRYSFPQGLTAEQLCHCMDTLSNAINDAIQQERERCALIADGNVESESSDWKSVYDGGYNGWSRQGKGEAYSARIAAAIRAG
jgi:hypothetical protein